MSDTINITFFDVNIKTVTKGFRKAYPDKAYLLYSSRYKVKIIDDLKRLFDDLSIKYEFAVYNDHDFNETVLTLKNIISTHSEDEIYINLTDSNRIEQYILFVLSMKYDLNMFEVKHEEHSFWNFPKLPIFNNSTKQKLVLDKSFRLLNIIVNQNEIESIDKAVALMGNDFFGKSDKNSKRSQIQFYKNYLRNWGYITDSKIGKKTVIVPTIQGKCFMKIWGE